ncbi:hypothetical protein [Bacillus toyonensis]|uniref:hypothetical protein n=1 Tax=Bacillus toyonensis TaxID=155322 RepID=UPI000B442B23|nr:hypothetical protein [Bacillus toyonensis]MCU5725171.1 hypothetical protein [Bacillus toyonensis]MEC2394222.1 hypothetical protein [Bacillus toyonensis]OTX28575.1 hypothetical protein BK717_28700 [Bacillus thuringiensis serovar malayensis]PHE25586.1 hypothetical protein COF60_25425 [Bacillus toyonensis]
MSMECRERYIRQIANILTSKTKHTTGCLIEGEGDVCLEFQKELINALQDNHTLVCHIDFNDYTSETDCIAALKKARKQISSNKQDGKTLFLALTSFERVEKKTMDAVKVLIGSRSLGINLLVSANKRFVHLVGLTEYMVTLNTSDVVFSELYRYSTQKVLASLKNDSWGEADES